MALTESTVYDKIEIVGEYKAVQVRQKTTIKKDDVQIASSFHRYTLYCGALKGGFKEDGTTPADDADDFVDTDLSSQPTEVQNICNAVWTTDVKTAFKALLISQKTS
tara:strand:+ start:29 stop:349 length:321 start_codon:yes stop_codon:yes gene_type:complete